MEIKKVMVIGAGQMGGGIAQVCAQAGFDVKLNDIKEESYQKGLGVITKNLSRNVEKGRMTEDEKTAVLGRITKSLDLQDAADVDIIIEAAVENMDIKQSIFAQLMQSHLHMQSWHRIHHRFRLQKSRRQQTVLKK